MDGNLQATFRKIYQENLWGNAESRSGAGSTLPATDDLRRTLPAFLQMLGCKTFLDAPCGDFHWMKEVSLGDIQYIGMDIVPEMVQKNIEQYAAPQRQFGVLDVTTDPLPRADVWMCRDLLIHLPLITTFHLLRQFLHSGVQYLMTTHFGWSGDNYESNSLIVGKFTNLTRQPFCLPEPLYTLKDFPSGAPYHRVLGVWSREQLAAHVKQQFDIANFLMSKP